jgi:hypothetical protein
MVDNDAEMMMIHRKVEECTAFLKSTLRPDYQRACGEADAVRTELDDYRQLQQQLWQEEQQVVEENEKDEPKHNATADSTGNNNISSNNKSSLVDLGFGVLSCEAVVVPTPNIINKNDDDDQNQHQQSEARSIFVHVGMGFHAELCHDEAQQAIQRRLQYLHGVWKTRQAAADAIRDHIVATEQILDELSRLKNISY